MGPLSDIYGRKPFLLLSLVGSCFGKLLFFPLINRLDFPRNVKNNVATDFLESCYRSFCRLYDSRPGVGFHKIRIRVELYRMLQVRKSEVLGYLDLTELTLLRG